MNKEQHQYILVNFETNSTACHTSKKSLKYIYIILYVTKKHRHHYNNKKQLNKAV